MIDERIAFRRSATPGRYEVFVGSAHIGWVVRHTDGRWQPYRRPRDGHMLGSTIGGPADTRREAAGRLLVAERA